MKKYAVIDIETTGGSPIKSRITEIAIVLYDGEKVLDRFETLINPESYIPYNITKLTGITDEMVADAPKFYEVAKQVVEMTKGAIFVAHNVNFDYKFIKEEFARLGYKYIRKQLCTVRLSRQTLPGLRSYSLDSMIKHLKIEMKDRHRAMADAEACRIVLEHILNQQKENEVELMVNRGVEASKLPPNITLEQLHDFPEECGVYYFHNKDGLVTYVGKSINIKKRLLDHFANQKPKAKRMCATVHEISYEVTGSELVALLFESNEIKTLRPMYNVAQKRTKFPIGIYRYTDEAGYICFNLTKNKKDFDVVAEYPNARTAQSVLLSLARKFELCKPLCNVENVIGGNCFNYQLNLCRGACMKKEAVDAYNERVEEAIERLKLDFDESFFIIENGRSADEKAVVLIEDNNYQGFGFIDIESANSMESLRDSIKSYPNNPDVGKIIKQYLKETKKGFKTIRL